MKKVALYAVAGICFATTYPMAPLFRAGQRIVPCARQTLNQGQLIPLLHKNIGYQSRQFFEPTTIAATAAGAYGLKKMYDYLRNQYAISQAKNMVVNPDIYSVHSFENMMNKLACMRDRSTQDDINGQPFSSKNSELLNALALANLESRYQNFNYHFTKPKTWWAASFKPTNLVSDIVNANRYKIYDQEYVIPSSIMRGLSIINNNKDLKDAFVKDLHILKKDIQTELEHSKQIWNPITNSKWPMGKLRVIERLDEIFGTKEEIR